MAFDPTRPVQTRDGRKARIICTDAKGKMPIVALVGDDDRISTFCSDGFWFYDKEECINDLINVPEMKSWWLNVYDEIITYYGEKHKADYASCPERLALIELRMCDGKLVEAIQHEVEK